MTEAEAEQVVPRVGDRHQPQLRHGEEQVEREGGDQEGDRDAGQDQSHPDHSNEINARPSLHELQPTSCSSSSLSPVSWRLTRSTC